MKFKPALSEDCLSDLIMLDIRPLRTYFARVAHPGPRGLLLYHLLPGTAWGHVLLSATEKWLEPKREPGEELVTH